MNSKLVKLKRQSYDIGLFGKKSTGKTLILSFLGYLKYKQGATIYSNYPLNIPHKYINTLQDLNEIYKENPNKVKIFLGDDFERCFNSRNTRGQINKELNDILLDWGKINCSLYYTAKRSMAIDIGLRDSTSEFWFPELKQGYKSENPNINKQLKDYLNFLYINITRFDENLDTLPSIRVFRLQNIVPIFDTQTIITPIRAKR